VTKIVKILKSSYLDKRLKEISRLIATTEAELINDDNKENRLRLTDLLKEFNSLTEEIKNLND